MLKALCLFPGSYLVRAQEGELKYMAAFASPTAAVQWCLVVQEASMKLPYPEELLLGSTTCTASSSSSSNTAHTRVHTRVQYDASGRVVFRGFRLKMGMCEGVPKCILPDHVGRADYHGSFVNQAARYADAAAHGGQIVTDVALAEKVLQAWQRSAVATIGGAAVAGDIGRNEGGELAPAHCTANGVSDSSNQGDVNGALCSGRVALGALEESSRADCEVESWISACDAYHMSADNMLLDAASALGYTSSSCSMEPLTLLGHSTGPPTAAGAAAAAGGGGLRAEPRVLSSSPLPPGECLRLVSPCTVRREQQVANVQVEAHNLGTYVFKGDPGPINMVVFYARVHLGRKFPSHAPKGKGFRVKRQQGVLGAAMVELPASLCNFAR
jgi:hypothetical protein